jgi:hypothetical protein
MHVLIKKPTSLRSRFFDSPCAGLRPDILAFHPRPNGRGFHFLEIKRAVVTLGIGHFLLHNFFHSTSCSYNNFATSFFNLSLKSGKSS